MQKLEIVGLLLLLLGAHADTYAQRYDVIIPGRIKMQFSMRNEVDA